MKLHTNLFSNILIRFSIYTLITISFFFFKYTVSPVFGNDLPFHKGVNLTNWFQESSAQDINFTKYTKQDFINIISLGCDVIRLPIKMHSMTSGEPYYTIDPMLFYFLDQVVDWAEELELNLILDNHTYNSKVDTDPDIGRILNLIWRQIAEHYKKHSTYIYYEVLNEPHGILDSSWNAIQQDVVETIRSIDQTHAIIIGPANWNSYDNLDDMPQYSGKNLIYTFHFYEPQVFTHQGASWKEPSLESLSGIPFPYEAYRMPDLPSELAGTWVESKFNNYQIDGTENRIRQFIDIAHTFKANRNIQLFCGEFGVLMTSSNNNDRIHWYKIVRSYFEEKQIPWIIWDYKGDFGLFEAGTNELFNYDLNIPLIESLGLNAPPQSNFILKPDETGFDIYSDFIAQKIVEQSWTEQGTLDFYSDNEPFNGKHCILWTNVNRHDHIGFNFKPIQKDLSLLVNNGYCIEFWVKGDSPGAKFDIRFIDTKTDAPDDHPWRMRMTIDETIASWNGKWQHVKIPLKNFTEHGAWDNGWFTQEGKFDWHAIDHFQIVAEHHSLENIRFWFDDIRIVNSTSIENDDNNISSNNDNTDNGNITDNNNISDDNDEDDNANCFINAITY